ATVQGDRPRRDVPGRVCDGGAGIVMHGDASHSGVARARHCSRSGRALYVGGTYAGLRPSQVFCARNGRSELTTIVLSDTEVRGIVERMLVSSGRRLDMSTPFVD